MNRSQVITAIGFDLGNTLTHHEGIPLSWQKLYKLALNHMVEICAISVNETQILEAENILAHYNTRLFPRIKEVTSKQIFNEILYAWNHSNSNLHKQAEEAFFNYFIDKSTIIFDDVIPLLQWIKIKRISMGILSDVAYGMPRDMAIRDLNTLDSYFDTILFSVDIGFRKPSPIGFIELAKSLGVNPGSMIYVGDEEKDIVGAKAAGMIAVHIDRDASCECFGEDFRVSSLADLSSILGSI